jgi:hypothetical protein
MALTLPVRLMARIVDELAIEARSYAYALIDPSSSFTSVLAFLTSWLTDLDACTDGQIVEGTITAVPALPGGLKGGAEAGSRVEQTGLLNFLATGTSHVWAETVPALSNEPTVISAGKIVLTPGNPVPVFSGLMLTGSSILEYTNNQGQVLASFKNCSISFREYNRQLATASYER